MDTGVQATGDAGADGKNGADGANGVTPNIGSNGNWWIGSTDTGIKAAGRTGTSGEDGVGIADLAINENGELVVTLTDGTEKNLGRVKGVDGVGVSAVAVNDKGELNVTLTDGTELNAGAAPMAPAEDSGLKTIVYVSLGTAVVSLAGVIGLLAFLLSKRRSLQTQA